MQKKVLVLAIIPSLIYAAYNPFFTEKKSIDQPKKEIIRIIEKPKQPLPQRKNIEITYFGFVESKKGKFALVSFNDKNIVIRQRDSLYLNEQIFKVKQITSNFILFTDKHYRVQTVYFSSEIQRQFQ